MLAMAAVVSAATTAAVATALSGDRSASRGALVDVEIRTDPDGRPVYVRAWADGTVELYLRGSGWTELEAIDAMSQR